MGSRVRVKVKIRGTRPLMQHGVGEDFLPLEKGERTGVAGNDPEEWRKSCFVTKTGVLFIPKKYIFATLRDAAKFTKKGKGSIQAAVAATLQIEDHAGIILNRQLQDAGDSFNLAKSNPPHDRIDGMDGHEVYVDVQPVRNPSTKARNLRYRLTTSHGWECSFTISFDKTIVSREQMRAVINDASTLVGIADGRSIGMGRFEVLLWEMVQDAEETTTEGSVGHAPRNRLDSGRDDMRPLQEAGVANGVPL